MARRLPELARKITSVVSAAWPDFGRIMSASARVCEEESELLRIERNVVRACAAAAREGACECREIEESLASLKVPSNAFRVRPCALASLTLLPRLSPPVKASEG